MILRQRGFARPFRRLNLDRAVPIQRAGIDGIPDRFRHGQRFPGNRGLVHGGAARRDLAVQRDLLSRFDEDPATDLDALHVAQRLVAVALEHAALGRCSLQERPDRLPRPSHTPRLQRQRQGE